jgi:uncharacterized protein YegL
MLRRLPVYLLLDCSESMAGPPLEAVQAGVGAMVSALRKNPYAIETAFLSVITFGVKARVLTELTELTRFKKTPKLEIRPGTSLGAALDLVRERIGREVVKSTPKVKGDYKPLIFILTDGQPTDDWRSPLARLMVPAPMATIHAVGCGPEVDYETLSKIADVCVRNDSLTPESLARLFVWLSASVQSRSVAPEKPVPLDKVPLGEGMSMVDTANPPKFSRNVLFFHSTCYIYERLYLMRYRRFTEGGLYYGRDAIKVPSDFLADGSTGSPAVDSSLMAGQVACPWCGAQGWCHCSRCGLLMCIKTGVKKIKCVKCGAKLRTAVSNFSASGSGG